MLKNVQKVIFLNAGHWNEDPGAVYGTLKESKETMKIRDLLVPLLKRHFIVYQIPDNLDLNQSIAFVNRLSSKLTDGLALSLHFNASGNGINIGDGAEALYYGWFNKSKQVAKIILDKYCEVTGFRNRGPKSETQTRFGINGWVHYTNPWATLLELCFLDNLNDIEKLIKNRDLVAQGIYEGVCEAFGIKVNKKDYYKKKLLESLNLSIDYLDKI